VSYLRGDYYVWSCDDEQGVEYIHVWTTTPSPLSLTEFDPMWKAGVMLPMVEFDKVVVRRAEELGWTPPPPRWTPPPDPWDEARPATKRLEGVAR
jgi:hypothetical protein